MDWVRNLGSLPRLFFFAVICALGLRLFVLEDFRVVSASMSPGLLEGDLLLASKLDYALKLPFSTYEIFRFNQPKAGDVVVFQLPGESLDTYVKRVVAVAGDEVSLREGVLSVNDEAAEYTPLQGGASMERQNGRRVAVMTQENIDFGPISTADHCFVLGDNRVVSVDSRVWGPIPYSYIKGRVRVVWASLDEKGSLRRGRIGLWLP